MPLAPHHHDHLASKGMVRRRNSYTFNVMRMRMLSLLVVVSAGGTARHRLTG
jgi:hypothetical protein